MEKRRRCWSKMEEEVLIAALKKIVLEGWKCQNGFRSGYLRILEGSMLKAFPGTDIRAEPHINSKLQVWKKHYASLAFMLGLNGITWNDSMKMIDARDDVWNLCAKTDINARKMRYKSWPFYSDWCEIFGKERVISADVVRELEMDKGNEKEAVETNKGNEKEAGETNKGNEKEAGEANKGNEKEVAETNQGNEKEAAGAEFGCVSEGDGDEHEMSVCQPQSDEITKQAPKKRKMPGCGTDPFVGANAINDFCDKLEARFEDIARRRIGFEHDISKARRALYGAVGRVPGLEVRDKLRVAKFLVNRTGDLDLFFSLPEEDRVEMVNMILAGQY